MKKILLILINICIVACLILAVVAIVKNSDSKPLPEASPPPFIPETEITTTTVMPEATTAVTTPATVLSSDESVSSESVSETAAAVLLSDYDKNFYNNYLFIGDSISTGLYGYNYLNAANVFAEIGFTPENIRTGDVNGTTIYQKLAVAKPDKVCIMLGTNGLSYVSVETMISHYTLFIDEIRDITPDCEIILFTIPPVTKEHEDTKPENLSLITSFNEAVIALAEEKEAEVFDVYSLLADENGYTKSEYAEADGLHLKGAAYTLILSELQVKEEETE
ncbi:MAG: GDSL-type esterase/lipase family protein [Ruminococcus sp.]|nr:GDSL-type esterase/lipase family protein [Ruminococcus sp.]